MKEFRRLNTTNQKFPTVWAALSVAIKEKLWGMVEIVKKEDYYVIQGKGSKL